MLTPGKLYLLDPERPFGMYWRVSGGVIRNDPAAGIEYLGLDKIIVLALHQMSFNHHAACPVSDGTDLVGQAVLTPTGNTVFIFPEDIKNCKRVN